MSNPGCHTADALYVEGKKLLSSKKCDLFICEGVNAV